MANKNFIVKNGIEVGSGVIDFPSGSVMLRRANSGSDRIRITSGSIIHDTNTVISGNLEVTGNFNIAGDINQTSVTTLDVTDKTITVANNAGSAANANNAGLIVDTGGTLPSLLYTSSGDKWNFNKNLSIAGLADATLEITSNSGGDPTITFNALQANRSALFRYLDNGSASGGYYKYSHLTDEHQFGSATATNINLKIGDFKTTVFGYNSSSSDWGNRGLVSSVQINAANRTFSGLVMDDTGSGDGAAIGFRYDGSGYKLELATAPSSGGALSTHLTIDRLGAITTSGHLDVGDELTVGNTTILKDSGVVTIKAAPLGSTYGGGFNAITVTGTSSSPYTSTIGFSNYGETDAMVIKGANVGIGEPNPTVALDITRNSGWAEVHFDGPSGGDLIFKDNGVNIGEIYAGVGHGMVLKSYASQDMSFLTGGNATAKMILDTSGRLAINQTPLANNFALQVTGLGGASNDARAVYLKGSGNHTSIGSTGPTLVLQNTNSTANNIVKLSFESASSGETVSINAINTAHSTHYGDMAFNTRGSAGYSEKLRITSNGEIRVQNQTLVDSANTNHIMIFPNNKGISIGSAYTYGEFNANNGDVYIRANSYPANTGSASKIYLQTANSSGGQNGDVVVQNGHIYDSTGGVSSNWNAAFSWGDQGRFQVYQTGTGGFRVETGIAANNYGFIHADFKVEEFNYHKIQNIELSATVNSNGTVYSASARGDQYQSIVMFVYNGNWCFHLPSLNTYTQLSAHVSLGAGYQGGARSRQMITAIYAGGIPGSGVTGNHTVEINERIAMFKNYGPIWTDSAARNHFTLTKNFSASGSSVTRSFIDVATEIGAGSAGSLRYEVSIQGYGSGGTNGINAKYSVGGYSGHNYSATNYGSFGAGTIQNGYKSSNSTSYNAQGLSYHPCVNMGSYMANGEVWAYVPGPQQYGFTVSNNSSNGVGCTILVEGWYS